MKNKFKKSLIILFIAAALMLVFIKLAFFDSPRQSTPTRLAVDNFTDNKNSNNQENNLYKRLPVVEDKPLRFLFFGDMMLDRHVGEKISQNGEDWLFKKLASTTGDNFFMGYNIIGVNLEGAVTDKGEHYAPQMSYDFAFHPSLILGLKKHNFNFFSLANNHFADQGERGIIETRRNLDVLKLDYAGCRDSIVGECSTKIIKINNKEIGFASFSMVYSLFDLEQAGHIIAGLASSSDLVVVNAHWGKEYEHFFGSVQAETAHSIIDSGADIIIGHHPHVVQGIEIYNNKPIFYSLGNFIFDQYFSPDTQEGLALGIEVRSEVIEFNLYPFKSRLSQVELMNEKEQKEIFGKLLSWSDVNFEFSEQIKKGKLEIKY